MRGNGCVICIAQVADGRFVLVRQSPELQFPNAFRPNGQMAAIVASRCFNEQAGGNLDFDSSRHFGRDTVFFGRVRDDCEVFSGAVLLSEKELRSRGGELAEDHQELLEYLFQSEG